MQILINFLSLIFSLNFQQQIFLHTIADNIDVDQSNGDLYMGCHPIPYRVVPYLQDPAAHNPPSQVNIKT